MFSRVHQERGVVFDDIQIGDDTRGGRHVFCMTRSKSFAIRFDLLFHVDDDAAMRCHFGALWRSAGAASGCGCSSIIGVPRTEEARGRGEPVVASGWRSTRDLK